MKILIVNITKPQNDIRSTKLKRALEKQGHEVELYWALRSPRFKIRGHVISIIGYGITLVRNLIFAMRVDCDVVHLIDGWDLALVPFLIMKKPKIFDIRSLWPYMLRRIRSDPKAKVLSFVKELITRIMIAKCDRVVTVDPRIAQRIKRYGAKNITYLRNLPEEDMFKDVPYDRDSRYLDFAYVGSFGMARRTHELLLAWHQFVVSKPIPCRLFLIGWDCSGELYFKTKVEPYVDNKTVFYLGRKSFEEISPFYKKMDFITIPNLGDHWQLKLGESLAAGVPVILREGQLHRMMVGSIGAVYFKSDRIETDVAAIKLGLESAFINRDKLKAEASSRKPPYWEQDVRRIVELYQNIG